MLIFKNLLRRKTRTMLSLLGIAIGIAAIIAFNAIGRGFKKSLMQYMDESGAQMLVLNKTVQDPAFSRITGEEVAFIRGLPGVEHLSGGTFTMASPRGLKRSGGFPAVLILGRTPGDRLLDRYKTRIQGRMLEGDHEIMMGVAFAENTGLKPGDTLDLFRKSYVVSGIFDSAVPFERVCLIMTNTVIQQEMKMGDSVSLAFVYVDQPARWGEIKAAVESRYGHLTAIKTEEFTLFYDQLEYIDWFVWVISLGSILVGGLGVLNTMLMSVSERTREIGTLRAVGWSRGRVLRLILAEGAAISVAGGVAGLFGGWGAAELLMRWAPRDFLSAAYTPALFGQGLAIAFVLGFLGSLYPAWQASRLAPVEALKYE